MSAQQIYSQGSSKMTLVSFIIPVYNLPVKLVTDCLDSIIMLSLDDTEREIIVIDDGSSTSLCSDLQDYWDQIIYIRQRNQGLSVARNVGMRMAQGKYIQFVDGDDALIPFMYEHCLDIVRYHNADMVVFDHVRTKQPGTPTCHVQGPMTGSEYMSNANLKASVWRMLFQQKILHGLQFTPNLANEDEAFTPLLVLHAEQLYVTDAKAYYYRRREQSITNTTNKRYKVKRLNDLLKIITQFQTQLDSFPPMEQSALQRRIAQLSMDYIYNTARDTHSMKHLQKAIAQLKERGLYPLPNKNYTHKYLWFRRLIQTSMGRWMLLLVTWR